MLQYHQLRQMARDDAEFAIQVWGRYHNMVLTHHAQRRPVAMDDPVVYHTEITLSELLSAEIPPTAELVRKYNSFAEANSVPNRICAEGGFYVLALRCAPEIEEAVTLAMSRNTSDAGILINRRIFNKALEDMLCIVL